MEYAQFLAPLNSVGGGLDTEEIPPESQVTCEYYPDVIWTTYILDPFHEEGQRTHRPKRCQYNNKDEDNPKRCQYNNKDEDNPKMLKDKIHQASCQKFSNNLQLSL